MASDRLQSPDAPEIAINLIGTVDGHGDRYSTPIATEVAALLVGGMSVTASQFDIVVETISISVPWRCSILFYFPMVNMGFTLKSGLSLTVLVLLKVARMLRVPSLCCTVLLAALEGQKRFLLSGMKHTALIRCWAHANRLQNSGLSGSRKST
ncbi:hypothetical protein BDA96_05G069100 [Sorghum bicolor]|nr:hypothetical protein BDA96_05G069100 [Sorghum bicolor]